jgi:hypothetical protein
VFRKGKGIDSDETSSEEEEEEVYDDDQFDKNHVRGKFFLTSN